MKQLLLIASILFSSWLRAQTGVNASECFFDTDPGPGTGIALPINDVPDSSVDYTVSFIPPLALTPGYHRFYFRTRSSDLKWSIAEPRLVVIKPKVMKVEYFLDTDPGIGLGTIIWTGAVDDSIDQNISVNTTGLPSGYHRLFIRTFSDEGKVSLAEPRIIFINPKIIAAE